jgi:hypothetical protein
MDFGVAVKSANPVDDKLLKLNLERGGLSLRHLWSRLGIGCLSNSTGSNPTWPFPTSEKSGSFVVSLVVATGTWRLRHKDDREVWVAQPAARPVV